jgi:DNA topoisomerase-1
MSKSLVIVESPAKAKTINKYLGNNYVVEASFGHIMDLPKRDIGVELENRTFEPTLIVTPDKEKLVAKLRKMAASADAVYLAPDPDREGEAIAAHLARQLMPAMKDKSRIHRVTFNEIRPSSTRGMWMRIWWTRSRRGACWTGLWAIRFRRCCGTRCGAGFQRGAYRRWRCG